MYESTIGFVRQSTVIGHMTPEQGRKKIQIYGSNPVH